MGYPKIWAVPGYAGATLPFLKKYGLLFFVLMDPVNVPVKFEVRIASPVSEIIAIDWSFGWGLRTPDLGEEEVVGDRG